MTYAHPSVEIGALDNFAINKIINNKNKQYINTNKKQHDTQNIAERIACHKQQRYVFYPYKQKAN